MALRLDVATIDTGSLENAISELLTNLKYAAAAKLRSRNFQDQKEKPIERAMWWIDYVLRNPDVSFLRNKKMEKMNYFTKHSIDVIAFVTVLGVAVLLVVVKISSYIWRWKKSGGGQKKVKLN